MKRKILCTIILASLLFLCFRMAINISFISGLEPEPIQLKIYVSPPKIPADNKVYEAIFVQLQNAKGVPVRAKTDVDIYLSSSSKYVGSVDSNVTIHAGETYTIAKFYSTYTPGTTTITATASGFATVQASVTTVGPVPYKLVVYGLPPILPADGQGYRAIVVQLQDSSGTPARAPIGDVSLTLVSSNTTVGAVDPYLVIREGETYAIANFYPNATGSTTITAMASGYVSGQTVIKTQSPSDEPSKLKVYISPPKVPAEGKVYTAIAIQLQDSKGRIARACGNTTIVLSSSNIAVGFVNDIALIKENETYATANFSSTYRSGSTIITAAATDLQSSQETLTTVGPIPSKLAVYCAPSSLPSDGKGYNAIIVQLQDSQGMPAKDPEGDVEVSLFSSKPYVGTVDSKLIIPYGKTYAVATFYSTLSAGSTYITAQTAGYTSAQTKVTTYLIDEYALKVNVLSYPEEVNSGEKVTVKAYVTYDNISPALNVTVKFSSDSKGSFSSVIDEKNGSYVATFTTPSVTSRTIITIFANASKTGYISGIGNKQITVNPIIKTGSIRIYVKDEKDEALKGATVASIDKPSGMSAISSTTDETGLVAFTNILSGSYVFEIKKEGYEKQNVTLNVMADRTITVTVNIKKSPSFLDFSNITFLISVIAICVAAVGVVALIVMKLRHR